LCENVTKFYALIEQQSIFAEFYCSNFGTCAPCVVCTYLKVFLKRLKQIKIYLKGFIAIFRMLCTACSFIYSSQNKNGINLCDKK